MKFFKKLVFAISQADKLFKPYRWKIAFLALLGFLAGLIESIGIGTLIPILSILVGGDAASGNDVISIYVTKIFRYFGLPVSLPSLFILIASLFVFRSATSILFNYSSVSITTDFERNTRSALYKKTLFASWPYLLKQKIGHLENTLMLDVTMTTKIMYGFTSFILDITSLIAYVFIAVNISRFITGITLGLGVMLFVFLYPFMVKTRRNSKKQSALSKMIAHHIDENIIGTKVIKVFGAEEEVSQRGKEFFDEVGRLSVRQALIRNSVAGIISPVSIIFMVAVFALSYRRPTFTLSVFAATMYLIQRIFIHLNTAQKTLHSINDFFPHLLNVVDLKKNIERHQENISGSESFNFLKELEFKNVSFSYENGKDILSSIDLKIKKGEMIGIIGPSGSGKTTIVDLILRLFHPQSGKIMLDGRVINEINTDDWKKNISYVPQDVFLLNETIKNNIKFYDDSISEEDVIYAAKMANIYDFIVKLENGFDTLIGERGVLLSGGQKQRISLARALARRPSILILDEATSALDNESESLIQKSIENLRGLVTVIIIAHRISTVMNADKIIVVDEGTIKESGSPPELLKDKDSYFFRMSNII